MQSWEMMGSRREEEMERRWKEPRGFPWRCGLRWVGWTALLAAFGLGLAGSAQGAGAVTRPAETADAVLVSENQSWNRYLHDALRLPSWLDLAIEHRTRFEFLEGPFRPGRARHAVSVPAAHPSSRGCRRAGSAPLPGRASGLTRLRRRTARLHLHCRSTRSTSSSSSSRRRRSICWAPGCAQTSMSDA